MTKNKHTPITALALYVAWISTNLFERPTTTGAVETLIRGTPAALRLARDNALRIARNIIADRLYSLSIHILCLGCVDADRVLHDLYLRVTGALYDASAFLSDAVWRLSVAVDNPQPALVIAWEPPEYPAGNADALLDYLTASPAAKNDDLGYKIVCTCPATRGAETHEAVHLAPPKLETAPVDALAHTRTRRKGKDKERTDYKVAKNVQPGAVYWYKVDGKWREMLEPQRLRRAA